MKPNKVEVGKRIREVRINLRYSMSEFGQLISNSPRSSVNNWESGICLPKKNKLEIIALLGRVSISWLLYGNIENFVMDVLEKFLELEGTKEEKEDFLTMILAEVPEKEREYDVMMWLSVVDKVVTRKKGEKV